MKLAEQIALWADRLRDVSALGLHFADNPYDKEHYQVVQDVAMAMYALAGGELPEAVEPLREPLFARPTPISVGDAAVIDAAGRILLIRRADNGCWAMPGGALEVGETPAAGVLREVLEETGVHCRAVALAGVYDSRLCGTTSRHHLYQITFLCAPLDGVADERPSHANETLDVRWFAGDALPEGLDPGHASRIAAAFHIWRCGGAAFFDAPGAAPT
jgi:ADP-ribose pyrophosphatase YjhB (NUDIX family)